MRAVNWLRLFLNRPLDAAVMTDNIHLYQGDVPDDFRLPGSLAIDTETMGLIHGRDRLCLVQISNGNGEAHLVQIANGQGHAPHLKKLIETTTEPVLMHFARFDIASLKAGLDIDVPMVFCTKIASKIARSFTNRHGLKDLCLELLSIDISKQQQSSDWGAETLSAAQLAYAASDVLHLHKIAEKLKTMLDREERQDLAQAHFDFLSTRAAMDLLGWETRDLFAHSG